MEQKEKKSFSIIILKPKAFYLNSSIHYNKEYKTNPEPLKTLYGRLSYFKGIIDYHLLGYNHMCNVYNLLKEADEESDTFKGYEIAMQDIEIIMKEMEN